MSTIQPFLNVLAEIQRGDIKHHDVPGDLHISLLINGAVEAITLVALTFSPEFYSIFFYKMAVGKFTLMP